jgi:hypothetical protein
MQKKSHLRSSQTNKISFSRTGEGGKGALPIAPTRPKRECFQEIAKNGYVVKPRIWRVSLAVYNSDRLRKAVIDERLSVRTSSVVDYCWIGMLLLSLFS